MPWRDPHRVDGREELLPFGAPVTGAQIVRGMLPPDALRLGLGCSRLGSVGGASKDEGTQLLHAALDHGVRFFDTSNIYGQGDSERLLGDVVGRREDCVIVSKAGKYVTWQRRALTPLKSLMRASARRSSVAKGTASAVRSKPMPTNWDPDYLVRSLHGSLRRLGRDHVDVFMLHSPSADVIEAGHAVTALDNAKGAGKIRLVGVSVDDLAAAEACLADDRIQAIQLPVRPGDTAFANVVSAAADAGVAVIARELLGGIGAASGHKNPAAFARAQITAAVRDPKISVPLIGSTRLTTLSSTVEAVRGAMSSDS